MISIISNLANHIRLKWRSRRDIQGTVRQLIRPSCCQCSCGTRCRCRWTEMSSSKVELRF